MFMPPFPFGSLFFDFSPLQHGEVFSQVELLRSVGLGVPDTTALLYALNARGWSLPLDAISVEDCAKAILSQAF